jgi:diguanylate cyclase (GGDEF)-like protein
MDRVDQMSVVNRSRIEDLPDLPHARQSKAGFPWLTFSDELEREFRRTQLDATWSRLRISLSLAITIIILFSPAEATVLGPTLNRLPSMIHMWLMIPILLIGLAATFTPHRQRVYPPLAFIVATILGLSVAAIQIVASLGGVSVLFPSLVMAAIFIYFMVGLNFYHALASNCIVMFSYLAVGAALGLPAREFGYHALVIVVVNLFGAVFAYIHEKTSRKRFLEAGLLQEMVSHDGLTGIQNRRTFDQHIQRVWQQAVRASERLTVLLIDIDCFKEYNDRYGHQAGDRCLRAVATSLSQCARRPLDFVARYGGEEFAIVLYETSREYVAEVLNQIQRAVADLNIPHESSRVASRLTVSIGAAFVLPGANRTYEGLIQLADEALYSAKEQGKNRVVIMEAEYQTLKTGRFDKRRLLRAR